MNTTTWQTPEEFRSLPRMLQLQLVDQEWPTNEERLLTEVEQRLLFARLLLAARQYNQTQAELKAHRARIAEQARLATAARAKLARGRA